MMGEPVRNRNPFLAQWLTLVVGLLAMGISDDSRLLKFDLILPQ